MSRATGLVIGGSETPATCLGIYVLGVVVGTAVRIPMEALPERFVERVQRRLLGRDVA